MSFRSLCQHSERCTFSSSHSVFPLPVDGRGSEGVGPDLPTQNYEDIGEASVAAQNYLRAPAGR